MSGRRSSKRPARVSNSSDESGHKALADAQVKADTQAQSAAPASVAGRIATVVFGVVSVWVFVGSFMMGTASGGYDDERPVHAVTLTRSFEL